LWGFSAGEEGGRPTIKEKTRLHAGGEFGEKLKALPFAFVERGGIRDGASSTKEELKGRGSFLKPAKE